MALGRAGTTNLCSGTRDYCGIVKADCLKTFDAFRFVAARLGVPIEQTAAIGDSWNDAPLLEAAGFGIAMGSAPSELRAVAAAVVADLEHDGVAEAIDRYVMP